MKMNSLKSVFSDELSGFVAAFQCLSLFPYSNNPIWNLLLKIYSILSILLALYIFTSAFYIHSLSENEDSVSALVSGLILAGLIITHLLNIFQSLISHKKQCCIYQIFDEIDYMFQHQLLVNIRYQNIRKYLWRKFIIIAILLISIKIVSIYYSGEYIGYTLHTLISSLLIQYRCLQAIFYVDLVSDKLKLLNNKIENVADNSNIKISSILCCHHSTLAGKKLGPQNDDLIYDQILTLKQIYGRDWREMWAKFEFGRRLNFGEY